MNLNTVVPHTELAEYKRCCRSKGPNGGGHLKSIIDCISCFEWSRSLLGCIESPELSDCDMMFICLNRKDQHWALAIVYPSEYKIVVIDSLDGDTLRYWRGELDDLKFGISILVSDLQAQVGGLTNSRTPETRY